VSPKVVSKMTLAEKLTADQQTSVRSGYATAAGVPIENVEIAQDTRRAVSYSVTVFVKDSAAATAVMTKLSDTAALKSALKAAVPDPRTIVCVLSVCVCVCLCVCVCAGAHRLTPLHFHQGLPASIADSATVVAPVQYASKLAFSTAVHGAYVPGGFMHAVICVGALMASSLGFEKY
jgi:hypothetical protein